MNKYERFWAWFVENEQTYYQEIESAARRDEIFEALYQELEKVEPDLVWEFSPISDNKVRELAISADGIKEKFHAVKELVDYAPTLENWRFCAFRQRRDGSSMVLRFDGVELSYKDIFFRYLIDEDGFGLELNIRGFSEGDGVMQHAVYLLLDTLIGEYDTTMTVNWIVWVSLDENNIDNLYPFEKLVDIIDAYKAEYEIFD